MTALRINEETIILVGVIVGVFVLALVCLACSLTSREDARRLRESCGRRCCGCCQRRRNRDSDEPPTYQSLNEYICEADEEQPGGYVVQKDNGNDRIPTTMEQVFPDLLGSDEPPPSPHPSIRQSSEESGPPSEQANDLNTSDLTEPLL